MSKRIEAIAQDSSTVNIGDTSISNNCNNTNSTVNNNNCNIYNTPHNNPLADNAAQSSSAAADDDRIEFNVQDCIESFTGRSVILDQLHKRIQANRESRELTVLSQTSVISGMGGVGKTETARKYVQFYKGSYHYVIWIGAETITEIQNSFRQLATMLRLALPSESHPESLVIQQVYNVLCRKPTLIVFDNAEGLTSDEDKAFGIKPYLPPSLKHGWIPPAILITSRSRNWHPVDKKSVIELEGLEDDECIQLLIKQLGISETDENQKTAMEIKLLCEGLPLVVQQVIAVIKQKTETANVLGKPAFTMADFIRSYEERKAEFLEMRPAESPAGKSAFVIFQLTFEKIATNETIGVLALKYLRMMSYLPPDNIPKSLFPHILDDNERNWTTMTNCLKLLETYNLIKSVDGGKFFRIHRVIQELALTIKRLCVGKILWVWRKYIVFSEVLIPKLVPQFTKILKTLSMNEESNNYDILQCAAGVFLRIPKDLLSSPTCAIFSSYLIISLINNSMTEFWVSVSEKILTTAQSENELINFKHDLAIFHLYFGSFPNARILLEEILSFQSQRYGGESDQVLKIQDRLATTLLRQGKHNEALKMQEYIVETRIRVCGKNHPKTIAAKLAWAQTLHTQLKHQEAMALLYDLLQEKYNNLSPDDNVTLEIELLLANTFRCLGNFEASLYIFYRLIPKMEQKFGNEHIDVWDAKYCLAQSYSSMGRVDEAYVIIKEFVEVLPRFVYKSHPRILCAKSKLALALATLGKFDEGISLIQDIKPQVDENSVKDYPTFCVVYNSFGAMLRIEGKLREAEGVYQYVITVLKGFLPEDHYQICYFKSLLDSLQEQMSASGPP